MRRFLAALVICALFTSPVAFAQMPAGAPAGSTGLCKDGSFTSNATKKGACAGHKGVKEWFADAAAPAGARATAVSPAGSSAKTTPSKAKTEEPAAASASKAGAMAAGSKSTAAAPGGGAGKVWINTDSKVYHCAGTRYYGKTKQGEYMTEAQAKAAGARPDHGKFCS